MEGYDWDGLMAYLNSLPSGWVEKEDPQAHKMKSGLERDNRLDAIYDLLDLVLSLEERKWINPRTGLTIECIQIENLHTTEWNVDGSARIRISGDTTYGGVYGYSVSLKELFQFWYPPGDYIVYLEGPDIGVRGWPELE